MQPSLVPLSIGDVFDEAFDLYKANFGLFAGIVAVLHVPTQIGMAILLQASGIPAMMDRLGRRDIGESVSTMTSVLVTAFSVHFLVWCLQAFSFAVQSAALTLAVSERYLGRQVSVRDVYRAALRRLIPLLGTWLLVVMAVVGTVFGMLWAGLIALFAAASGVPENAPSEQTMLIGGILALAAAGVAGLFSLVAFGTFVTQEVVLEKVAYREAIIRNWRLIRRRFLPVCGAILLCALFVGCYFFTIYGTMLYAIWTASSLFPLIESLSTDWLISGLAALVWLFIQPFPMICITLLYYDQRVRREGLDITMLERHLAAAHGVRA